MRMDQIRLGCCCPGWLALKRRRHWMLCAHRPDVTRHSPRADPRQATTSSIHSRARGGQDDAAKEPLERPERLHRADGSEPRPRAPLERRAPQPGRPSPSFPSPRPRPPSYSLILPETAGQSQRREAAYTHWVDFFWGLQENCMNHRSAAALRLHHPGGSACISSSSVSGQEKPAPVRAKSIPRTADGHPDLQGVGGFPATPTLLQRPKE